MAVAVSDNPAQTDKVGVPKLAYSMTETAEALGVSYITVHRLLKRGKLRASSAIRTKVIPAKELDRFLSESLSERPTTDGSPSSFSVGFRAKGMRCELLSAVWRAARRLRARKHSPRVQYSQA